MRLQRGVRWGPEDLLLPLEPQSRLIGEPLMVSKGDVRAATPGRGHSSAWR